MQEGLTTSTLVDISTEFLNKGYILANTRSRIIKINGLAGNMLGLKSVPDSLKAVAAALPKKAKLLDHIKYCGLERQSCSFKQLEVDGRLVSVFLTPIFQGDELTGSLLILEDVTEKIESERTREQFLNTLVHEFRTPLTAIEGNSSLLQEDFAKSINDPTVQQVIGFIRSGSHTVLQMVNQFLEMARLEDGRITFDLQKFDAIPVINQTAQELQVLAKEKQLELSLDSAGLKKVEVVADPHRTRQVLTNLIGNALKFTTSGSVSVRLQKADEVLQVFVTDTGPGIPEKDQSGLFQKYYQASNNKLQKDSSKSTGLGLYTTRMVVEGMGGSVELTESKVGAGSTFMFTLDIATKKRLVHLKVQQAEIKQGVKHSAISEHNLMALADK